MMARSRPSAGTRSALGATVETSGVHFAVWGPAAETVAVEIQERCVATEHPLARDDDGLHQGLVPGLPAGARYRYRLDGGASYPDPASRFQPDGVHGPSEVVDPRAFSWSDEAWPGVASDELVIYELHVGAYTPQGTFAALFGQLPELARLGVTAIELMPIADFAGRWNWGYDGVSWWAPSRAYGRPDDLRRLVDEAHRLGLAILLDVVYNHFGPDGAYWRMFSEDYFTDRHTTPWGEAINYDGPNSGWVREFVLQNACHWITEYHVDGLRLDATHAIIDDSPTHLLAELSTRVRAAAAPRRVVLIAEDERHDVRLLRPRDEGGYGLDAAWADDFHHAVRVFLTGESEGYYGDYAGTTVEIARTIEQGFLPQSQIVSATGEAHVAAVTSEPGSAFVFCIQNHDQVGNRAFGERLHHQIDLGRYAAASALLLCCPETPLLFMGQEFAASTPFLFFTDFDAGLGRLVTDGRRAEFAGFRAFADPATRDAIPDPQDPTTFLASKLDLAERQENAPISCLYLALLTLRREDPVLRRVDRAATRASAAGPQLVVVHRWYGLMHRILIANFGAATALRLSETAGLRDAPAGEWRLLLSTAEERFGGSGRAATVGGQGQERQLIAPARSAAIFAIVADADTAPAKDSLVPHSADNSPRLP
jgi:maltooligosyltrehalose trehalohydrolase